MNNTFYILLIVMLFSCNSIVLIDNPTVEDINLKIDNVDYKIGANSSQTIELSKDNHYIFAISANGDTLANETVEIKVNGLLNISKNTYILWTDLYCAVEDYDKFKNKLNLQDLIEIDGMEFEEIDFKLIDDVFIEEQWDYSLEEQMPDTVDVSETEMYKIASKLYTLESLKEEFDYYGDIDFYNLNEQEIDSIIIGEK